MVVAEKELEECPEKKLKLGEGFRIRISLLMVSSLLGRRRATTSLVKSVSVATKNTIATMVSTT